jgi:hypothetical protein
LRKVEKWASKPDALALDLLRFFELLWWSTSDLWSELYRVREKRIGWVIRISEQFYTDSAAKELLINLRIMAHCAFDSRATAWTGS